MDSDGQDLQQHKDFLSSFFPHELGNADHAEQRLADVQQQLNNLFNGGQAHMLQDSVQHVNQENIQIQTEILGNMMAMQGVDGQQSLSPQSQYSSPQLLLEQQFKLNQLQQLQQLQNQIFQQQIALISGQTPGSTPDGAREPARDSTHFHGLPTPGSSSELRPQPTNDYVSPMILQYSDSPQHHGYGGHGMDTQGHPSHAHYGHGSASAPAHIAFNSPHLPVPSSSEIDFDMSPLTSPWLGAQQHPVPPPSSRQQSSHNKRTASPSSDDMSGKPSRKRQSPAIRPTNPMAAAKKSSRGSKSASSTPLMRSGRPRRGSTAAGDTPSPVDLSMPPPAPPSNNSASASTSMPSSQSSPQLTPVTPASIMNLGRLGLDSGLAPLTPAVSGSTKGKGPARPKVSTAELHPRGKPGKKNSAAPLGSPSLKSILPAGNVSPNPGPSALQGQSMPIRKTSHKAAEQKRRDSLKTTFDDLRGLIPPVPLPSDENFPDEPILPGALPPRGPPKAGEGPNKGVSKLQLLMCGNDYIRQLKARVDRRDEEIAKLRREVGRLRGFVNPENAIGEEDLDLQRDIDAVEAFGPRIGLGGGGSSVGGDDEVDED
ncbi:hypothetical protein PLICRDRAFT_54681 [Plicaturopsis crispa FD-325 SS-3]|nr:hypothetical protein PLICRDRAFT_54681 [Plicaturopsis crispa FD-325 SS-3]